MNKKNRNREIFSSFDELYILMIPKMDNFKKMLRFYKISDKLLAIKKNNKGLDDIKQRKQNINQQLSI
jgi:hypothetical protein